MSTPQTTASIPQQVESVIEAAVNLGTSLARLGASVIVIPLSLLPLKTRKDTVQAAHNVIEAIGQVNLSAFKAASRASDAWLRELDTALTTAAAPAAEAQTLVVEAAPAKK
ncbi:MAG: hypothetical protein HGA45_13340 [Chloroflexales bacterium]|nr:hypothetical protein [Chloroflexales bacterium]